MPSLPGRPFTAANFVVFVGILGVSKHRGPTTGSPGQGHRLLPTLSKGAAPARSGAGSLPRGRLPACAMQEGPRVRRRSPVQRWRPGAGGWAWVRSCWLLSEHFMEDLET